MTTTHVVRGLGIMAVVRWVLLALVTALAAYTVWTFWGPDAASRVEVGADRFYCSMHPQVRSHNPGVCPICHMDLVPIPAELLSGAAPHTHASAPDARLSDVAPVSLSAEQQRLIGLSTTVVVRASLGDRLRVPGVVSAPESGFAEVRVRASGFVERVAVRQTGVRVARGQLLAWVYSPEVYRAEEEFLALTRWNQGASTAPPSTGTNDLAPAARRGLELLGLSTTDIAELTRTGQPIRAIPVRAPSAGYVTRFNAVLGSRAEPETALYELADLSTVWVIASVHEQDVAQVRVGMTARFAVTGQPGVPLDARVELLQPTLDESTRTSQVRLALPNPGLSLRPGQYGEVSFELPATEGLLVPRDAVIHTGEHEYVYVATGDADFEPRLVRTGVTVDAQVHVLEGLAAGDRVVSRGSFMLDSESRLQASLAAAPAPAGTP